MRPKDFNAGSSGLPLIRPSAGAGLEIPKRLIKCLNDNQAHYEILHRPKESPSRSEGWDIARYLSSAVIAKAGQGYLIAVVPNNRQVDVALLASLLGHPVHLQSGEEAKWLFPDCAVGLIPPFGNLYGLPTFVDTSVSKQEYIIFAGGTDTDYIKVNYSTYEEITRPHVGTFASRPKSIQIR